LEESGLTKLIKVVDNDSPHLIIFEHYFGKLTAHYNRRQQAQQQKKYTNNSLLYWTKELVSVWNVYCVPRCCTQPCWLQRLESSAKADVSDNSPAWMI